MAVAVLPVLLSMAALVTLLLVMAAPLAVRVRLPALAARAAQAPGREPMFPPGGC